MFIPSSNSFYKFRFTVFDFVFTTAFSAYYGASVPFSIFNIHRVISIYISIYFFDLVPANTSESHSQIISYILHTGRNIDTVLFRLIQLLFYFSK